MYIRRTKTKSSATGESYFSYRLVQSNRIGIKVKQQTLLNLGRHFDVPQDEWPILCARIEQLISGQSDLFKVECKATTENNAQRIAALLLVKQGKTTSSSSDEIKSQDLQLIDVDTIELLRPRTIAIEYLALWAMEQIGFIEILQSLNVTGPHGAAILGSIIGRIVSPGSELATYQWLRERSGLGELLQVDYESMNLQQLYRASDLLIRHRETLESEIFSKVKNLFDFETTITLYDLTNTYFEGESSINPKAKRGHSKEKRTDCPLITLGLMLDGSGFVRRSDIFAGNAVESKTLEGMLKGLGAPDGALVVMDRGIATEENLTWLREKGYRYLVVSRERNRQFDADSAISLKTAGQDTIQINKILSEDGDEVRLYCHSEKRAEKEQGINRAFMQRFEKKLNEIHEGLSRKRTEKRIDKLWQRIGRLKEKSKGVSQHYKIELIADESGEKAIALKWVFEPIEGTSQSHPGVYCLRSNETSWEAERLWRTYVMLTDLEAVFRSLKSELGLRPIYHHKEERVDGHLFITVLAYQFVQIIRRGLQCKNIHDRWATLRKTLSSQCRVTASFKRADGRTLHVRKATMAEPAQLEIFQALNIDPIPGGVTKTLI